MNKPNLFIDLILFVLFFTCFIVGGWRGNADARGYINDGYKVYYSSWW